MSGSNAKEATLGVSSSPPQASISTRVLSSYKTSYTLLSDFVPGQGKTKRVLIFLLKMVETCNALCLWQVHMSSFHGL
jgi:hypothetical protein